MAKTIVKKIFSADIRVLVGRQEAFQNLILNGSVWVSDLNLFRMKLGHEALVCPTSRNFGQLLKGMSTFRV